MKKILILLLLMIFLSCFNSFSMSDDECYEREGGEEEYVFSAIEEAAYGGNLLLAVDIYRRDLSSFLNWRGEWGRTVLHIAAFLGYLDLISFFVNTCKLDINITDENLRTPLHYAIHKGTFGSVEFLVGLGAKVSLKDRANLTALDLARAQDEKNFDIISFLTKKETAAPPQRGRSMSVSGPSPFATRRGKDRSGTGWFRRRGKR